MVNLIIRKRSISQQFFPAKKKSSFFHPNLTLKLIQRIQFQNTNFNILSSTTSHLNNHFFQLHFTHNFVSKPKWVINYINRNFISNPIKVSSILKVSPFHHNPSRLQNNFRSFIFTFYSFSQLLPNQRLATSSSLPKNFSVLSQLRFRNSTYPSFSSVNTSPSIIMRQLFIISTNISESLRLFIFRSTPAAAHL